MDQRQELRLQHKSSVLVEEIQSGRYILGKIVDYSVGSMGLRCESELEPGMKVFIGIENSPYSSSHDIFRAKVLWCEKLADDADNFHFAIGIKYC
jgi:hypothetical protein